MESKYTRSSMTNSDIESLSIDKLVRCNAQTVVVVPTRTLATYLHEQVARWHIAHGQSVWQSPEILNFADYCQRLWQANREVLQAHSGAHNLINEQQAKLLWRQTINASKYQETELLLLNVQQTARAAQSSWRLLNDWQIASQQISADHVADTEHFLQWLQAYQQRLTQRQCLDQASLVALLTKLLADKTESLRIPFDEQIWHSFDLLTGAQKSLIEQVQQHGIATHFTQAPARSTQAIEYYRYHNSADEITQSLTKARALIEADPSHQINIVIPDLAQCQEAVRAAVHTVFYPSESPLQVQEQLGVVRLSLGRPLNEWPAVTTALHIIRILNSRLTVNDLAILLRNQYCSLARQHERECTYFLQWLSQQRIRTTSIDKLPALYQQCRANADLPQGLHRRLLAIQQCRADIQERLNTTQRAAVASIKMTQWPELLQQWLQAWGWHEDATKGSLSSVQYQLLQRWQQLLDDFAKLTTVQHSAGLAYAIEILTQLARDTIFLPRSAYSPIVISGVYEAIGRGADTCFLLGQNQTYPATATADAFIATRHFADSDYPNVNAQRSFAQAQKVHASLLRGYDNVIISYAQFDQQASDVPHSASPLYQAVSKNAQFIDQPSITATPSQIDYHYYQDTQGPAWQDPSQARGGSAIFTNQSNCAFKAFATHQLRFTRQDEAQFGLDAGDRGNVVHRLLEIAWSKLECYAALNELNEAALQQFCQQTAQQAVTDYQHKLNDDKRVLLQAETPRLEQLLLDWLNYERKRPQGFAVVEREIRDNDNNIGGINFTTIIDRVDVTDDGRSIIIDYKTGMVNRNDWVGERLRSPQLPLYALTLDSKKNQAVSGIAFASVKQGECKFVELSETEIVATDIARTRGYQESWLNNRAAWPQLFADLAQDFIAGQAQVNPIDDKTCQYCELGALCRVAQLRDTST